MKQRERDFDLISVILEDCETLRNRIARFSLNQDKFVNNRTEDGELAYDAAMSPVYRIAEDALHLSESVQNYAPDYDWQSIRGFRNFVAHGYREIDRSIAWKVIEDSIPRLEAVLRDYLSEQNSSDR